MKVVNSGGVFSSPAAPRVERWLIYRPGMRRYLCVVAARDAAHALRVARQTFRMPRGATAVREAAVWAGW